MTTKAVKSLIVDHDPCNEDFVVGLSQTNLKILKFKKNSFAMVKGKDGKKALCSVYTTDCSDDKVLVNRLVRFNLGLLLGDPVRLERSNFSTAANEIYFQPEGKQLKYDSEIMKDLLQQYLLKKQRTICAGNKIILRGANLMEVVIAKMVLLNGVGITYPNTAFEILAPEEKMKCELMSLRSTSYSDVGGQNDALNELRRFECLMRCPSLYKSLNVHPARIILYGPEGLGKLMMAKAFANETGSSFVLIDNKVLTSNKENDIINCNDIINEKVNTALGSAPSVLCLNDLHLMTPASFRTQLQRNVAGNLIESLQKLEDNPNVILIGITTAVSNIYYPLLTLFSETANAAQIAFSIPDESRRSDILRLFTRNMKLEDSSIINSIAALTKDYTARKLKKLCKTAFENCKKNALRRIDNNDKTDPEFILYKTAVSMADFNAALKNMQITERT